MQNALQTSCCQHMPLTGQHQQARRERLLTSKRPMQLSKNTPSLGPARHHWHSPEPTKSNPALLQGRSQCPKAQRSRFSSRAALDLLALPATPEGATSRPGKSNRPATGHLTWRSQTPVSGPLRGCPRSLRLSDGSLK
jgi:hypothetical protein